MLSFNLMPIFKARAIDRPFTFLVKAGFTPHAANVILNRTTRTFRLDHIERLCKVLVCEPNDLLMWTPNSNEQYANDHPLYKLTQVDSGKDIKATLAKIPYKQLKEIANQINHTT